MQLYMGIQLTFKKLIKKGLSILSQMLPDKTFNSFYNFSFYWYKKIIHNMYYLFGMLNFLIGRYEYWKMVQKIYAVLPYTLVGISGLEATYKQTLRIVKENISGDCIELGVAKGGCAALIGSIIFDKENRDKVQRKLWLFDSYEGLPEPTQQDYINSSTGEHVRTLVKGSCCGTLDEVQNLLFNIFSFPKDRIIFVKGWFDKTIKEEKHNIHQISLLRIDADWYESTKDCIEGLYPKVVENGAVIIDDYESCYGCKKAINEYIDSNKLRVNLLLDGRGGCYFLKA